MTITTFQWEKIRDWEWLVEEEEIPHVPQTELPEFPMIRQGGQWDNPTDVSQLFLPLQVYSFINKDGEYGYYEDGVFKSITSSYPTEEQFKEYGLSDIGVIEGEILEDLLTAEKIQVVSYLEDDLINNLAVYGELNGQSTHVKQPRSTNEIERMVMLDNSGGLRYLFSSDKEEWKVLSPEGKWETITWENDTELLTKGMSKNAVKEIKVETWSELGEQVYVGVYIDNSEAGFKGFDGQKLKPIDTPRISDAKLYILNTKATIDVSLIGNKIFGNISDEDDNKVQYRITLNGEPILPVSGDFTMLHPQPQNINFRIPSEKIKMGESNHLTIEFQDAWGSTDTWHNSFIGELSGLLFYDELGELYSDDIGTVYKVLDFGAILAGQLSESQKITLHNTLGHPVKDVKIYTSWGEGVDKPKGTSVGYSPKDSPFTSTETISPALPMDDQEEFDFYVRLETDLHATEDVIGEMKICVTATEVTDEEYQEILKENGIE